MIDVIAVSYKGASDAQRLAFSLMAQTFESWRLLLVDNASDADESAMWEKIQALDPRISVMRTPRNLGYLGAASWAVKSLGVERPEWTIICNVDLVYSDDALKILHDTSVPAMGVVAPSIISRSTTSDQNPHLSTRPSGVARYRRRLVLGNVVTAQLALGVVWVRDRFSGSRGKTGRKDLASPWIYAPHGSCMCVSSEYFEKGGTLSFPLFLFGEEVFIAEECRRIGLGVKYVPDMRVSHVEHGQIGWMRPRWILREGVRAAKYVFDATK